MGIKEQVQKRSDIRDLVASFSAGILNVEIKDVSMKNKKHMFLVNGKDIELSFDINGKAIALFDRSFPSIKYVVKIKNKGTLRDDQRLVFWY